MYQMLKIGNITGLSGIDEERLQKLLDTYNYHLAKNMLKDRYYEGHVTLAEVNLGIALPQGMRGLEVGCEWGTKTVDVLAGLSMFDGFVGSSGNYAEAVSKIVEENRLVSEYMKACKDELKYGCTFATLSADNKAGCRIRFHSPQTAAALWSGVKGRLDYGFAIVDTVPAENEASMWEPSIINMYTDEAVIVLRRNEGAWFAQYFPHKMGRPLMEPLIWDATSSKPFGRSRIKFPIREMIKGFVRTMANASIALEFSTAPQKYMLGLTDEQYDLVVNSKFQQYVGAILAATTNPETGEKPTFGQFQQGSLSAHMEELRALATQFSAATGLTVTDTGVINDANPTSSDAILAQSKTLTGMAERLNAGNGDALKTIMMMAQAIVLDTTIEGLTDDQRDIMAHFKSPSMPSIAVTADAAIKIASARPEFAGTDVFMEMVGFDQASIRRIKAQEQRIRGVQLLTTLEQAPEIESGGEAE